MTGLPKEILVNDTQIRESLMRSVKIIIENVKATLEVTPPDLIADIYERGMVLTGGGAGLKDLILPLPRQRKFCPCCRRSCNMRCSRNRICCRKS